MRPTGSHSLIRQLLGQLAAAQVGLIAAALLVFPFVSPYVNYADIADRTVRQYLAMALHRGSDGHLTLEPGAAFLHYAARRPGLAFAVLARASGQVVPGSAPDLAAAIIRLGPLLPRDDDSLETGRPAVPGDTLIITGEPTPLGSMVMATAGNAFGWEDGIALAGSFIPALLPILAPLLLGTLVVVPLVVRRSMRPLIRAARLAADIDMRSLDQRLPLAGMPAELLPLLAAVNDALERLEAQVRRQALFIANAAHELRTPVAILQARIDAMSPGAPLHGALQGDVHRVGFMVEQLLSVARLEQRETLPNEHLDLVGLVRAVVASCAPLAIRDGRELDFEAATAPVKVRADVQALTGAVTNLIDNALRAEPLGGRVVVSVGPAATVAVVDHGNGVASEDREHVFEPLWRRGDGHQGLGLGLAIVREVARLHGGGISVGDTPGGGATFRLTLPEAEGGRSPRQA